MRKIKKVLFRDKEMGCSYKIKKLKKAIENSSPSNYKKLLCDIPYDSVNNIKEYLSEIKKATKENKEDFISALKSYDELFDSHQITKEYSSLIDSHSMSTIAFVTDFKMSLEEKSDKERVTILNPIKLYASLHLYKSLIDYGNNNEVDFIDQFMFVDFIDKIPSISYNQFYSNKEEMMSILNSLGIDGLVIFTSAGNDSFIVELVSTSNYSPSHTISKKILSIKRNKNRLLSAVHEEYTEKVEDLTSRLYFDLEMLDSFTK